jgi:hypothetical protein
MSPSSTPKFPLRYKPPAHFGIKPRVPIEKSLPKITLDVAIKNPGLRCKKIPATEDNFKHLTRGYNIIAHYGATTTNLYFENKPSICTQLLPHLGRAGVGQNLPLPKKNTFSENSLH